jgi:hypothetical protein
MWAPNFPFSVAQVTCRLVVTASTCWDADGCNVVDGISHKTCCGRLVPDESMVLSVDPEKLMVRKAKGWAPLVKVIEWRVVVAPVTFVLWKLKGDLSICEHQNKVITYPYDPFEQCCADSRS